jgi:hypothetical protein
MGHEQAYLNLSANVATLIARYIVPLDFAPRVTTAIALVIQTVPALILVTSRDEWLRQPAVMIVAVLMLATPPCGDEVWLNSINSQFHIAVAAGLCLALEIPIGVGRIVRAALLLIAPLCSPTTAALCPLFLLRSTLERDPNRALQGVSLITGALLQFGFFFTSTPGRGHLIGPATLASIIAARHIALPLLGHEMAALIANDLQIKLRSAVQPLVAYIVVGLAALTMVLALNLRRNATAVWMISSAIAIAAISYYGALTTGIELVSVDGSLRYSFASSALVDLSILALAATGTDRLSGAAWLLSLWLVATGLIQAWLPHDPLLAYGPSWSGEVARWRSDHTTSLAIWPTGWTMRLPAS